MSALPKDCEVEIRYAYPSSDQAMRLRHGLVGCYYVALVPSGGAEMLMSSVGFAGWASAKAFADKEGLPFSRWSMPDPDVVAVRAGGAR